MHHQIREFKLDNLKKRVSAGYLTEMLYMRLHTWGAKFANDHVFVSFLAKRLSNYQFEKTSALCKKHTQFTFFNDESINVDSS